MKLKKIIVHFSPKFFKKQALLESYKKSKISYLLCNSTLRFFRSTCRMIIRLRYRNKKILKLRKSNKIGKNIINKINR